MSSATDALVPRRYQEEIFFQSQKRNVIAALDTGSGKTFISTLLIKWITTQPSAYRKKVVFLAPKVELAEQQALFIEKHTSLRVFKLYGKADIDLTDREGWARKFVQHDVIVMTPQTFLNMLTHSVWHLSKVSLIVFDECHHARKNHPYNMLMREYKTLPTEKRPIVFGMTASPVWNPNQAEQSMKELESNMDATIIGVCRSAELDQSTPRPDEVVRLYPPSPFAPIECHVSSLYTSLCLFPALKSHFEWESLERRFNTTLTNLGSFAAAMYVYHEVWTRLRSIIIDHGQRRECDEHTLPDDIYHVADIILEYQPFFAGEPHILLEWCTPKMRVLVEILLQFYTSTFQGIIFVEQRQIAACLAKILPCLPQLKGMVNCAYIASKNTAAEAVSMEDGAKANRDTVKAFREGALNLLIATSVAEEGLDFPACDLVIRFDKMQNMVGYVQSRGRARNKASTFIVMVQSDEADYLKKLNTLASSEPALKELYQTRTTQKSEGILSEESDDNGEDIDPQDMEFRERYTVQRTGAYLSYDNAIPLLARLCSMLHPDKYVEPQLPKYSDNFSCVLQLPRSLPLSPQDFLFHGPTRHSKREAKRAVAFLAVKRLHQLEVFDDYLLPVSSRRAGEDLDGGKLVEVNSIPNIMPCVDMRDPWIIEVDEETRLWMNVVHLDGKPSAGLLTGRSLPSAAVKSYFVLAEVRTSIAITFKAEQCSLMDRFTRQLVWHLNTAREVSLPMSLYLVPLLPDHSVDFDTIERLLSDPFGLDDWSRVSVSHFGRCLVRNQNQHGRPYILRGIRHDLSPMSSPPQDGSREAKFPTYYAYYKDKFTRRHWTAIVPSDGPLIEVAQIPRCNAGKYPLDPTVNTWPTIHPIILLPLGCSAWFDLPYDLLLAYQSLPHLTRHITDVYRARSVRFELGLPPILDDVLVQALTIPRAMVGFDNQRLETLGDTVLKLCTTVHLFNRYPHRHEGQLDLMKQTCVSNRFLMTKALELGLKRFITGESHSLKTWRYVVDEDGRRAVRDIPRRSLQDCMEATLGAAYVTGGIPMALRAGSALRLFLGGPESWTERYPKQPRQPVPAMFIGLEDTLGYKFRNGRLLVQAVTHASFIGEKAAQSYQRLEFLGDALVDLVVLEYLYHKFPAATSEQLHIPKSRVICAPALAFLAVKKLKMHNIILMNNVDLSIAVEASVNDVANLVPMDIVNHGWKFSPPKVLSDVFESVMGAVLVDSGYNYDRAAAVVQMIMDDLLGIVSPSVKLDPITELHQWVAQSGCPLKPKFSHHARSRPGAIGVTVSLHDVALLVRPVHSVNAGVARFAAAERALNVLRDSEGGLCFQKVCTCPARVIPKTVLVA